ncbi:L-threonylcarbamoyladenylate synthase [Haliangium ochraceum]|uniref:L-threonylcarbamoyladenylate synthase n=1 Tax=Haliangium ochraceum (strain DSM 14365 / JCM 11303 / SMP-2) TaxID=502025 RepID=D0LU45_HALO1|nr:L-threonylcarbamoyladenylate synthase [Haliangium ochraceum]ACY17409.1 Sua5/YciO/YrdC/YwlC family protein [Haliangium ochraceum DSM 14365]
MSASERDVDRAVDILRTGGIVCMPTETTYGLAVDIDNPAALRALAQLKQRPADAPFGLVLGERGHIHQLTALWPPLAEDMARACWPGALTLVVPARPELPGELIGPGGGVGVRLSSHRVPTALAAALGRAITATSANPSGAPAACDIARARAYFGDAVHYLDGGPATPAASTVVAIEDQGDGQARARLLRAGPVDVARWLAPASS